MKKIAFGSVFIIIGIIIITSILLGIIKENAKVDEYANLKHFTYNDVSLNMISHDFFHGRDKRTYTISKIESFSSDFGVGLFYKIKNNDYVLLENFTGEAFNSDGIIFYQNEREEDLLIVCFGYNVISLYSLDGVKVKKIFFEYPASKIYYVSRILNIENDFLYLNANIYNTDEYVTLKCSLVDFNCVEYIENN